MNPLIFILEDDEKAAGVCVNNGAGCEDNGFLKIRLCPADPAVHSLPYYVYQLSSPQGCSAAYCVGDGEPCPDGSVFVGSIGENGTCADHYPAMTSLPTLKGPTVITGDDGVHVDNFTFTCEVGFPGNGSAAMFEVYFLFDGQTERNGDSSRLAMPSFITNANNKHVVLEDRYLRGRLGKTLSCSVRSFWKKFNLYSTWWNSTDRYWAGLKVDVDNIVQLTLSQPEVQVSYVSTVPVICPAGPTYETPLGCFYRMTLVNDNDAAPGCGYTVSPTTYVRHEHWADTKHQNIIFRSDPSPFNKDFLSLANFHIGSNDIVIWDGLKVQVQVHITSKAASVCTARTDPHITQFDGSYIHCFAYGDFYLWKSYTERIFEVQSQHWRWSTNEHNPSTICGVAVREGNHILGITLCQEVKNSPTGKYPVRFIQYIVDPRSPQGRITPLQGKTYAIVMPSGSHVDVDIYNDYLNVRVHGRDEDRGHSSGLCGNYDDDPNNDGWSGSPWNCDAHRVPAKESFFNKLSPPKCKTHKAVKNPSCLCGAVTLPNGQPDPNSKRTICNYRTTDIVKTEFDCNTSIKKRSNNPAKTSDESYSLDEIYNNMPQGSSQPPASWPTPGGISEGQARDRCLGALKESAIFSDCQGLVGLDQMTQDCMFDVQVSDSLIFIQDMTSVFETKCLIEIQANITLTTDDPTEQESQKARATEFANLICPNQCYKQGSCDKGECICDQDYAGVDCSLKEGDPPEVLAIWGKGRCDLSRKPCQTLQLSTVGVDMRNTVYCKIHNVLTGTVNVWAAKSFSTFTVTCPLSAPNKAVSKFEVSLSNGQNGKFSSPISQQVYDSRCMNCDVEGACDIKGEACLLDELCYAAGDLHEIDACFQCTPAVSKTQWTKSDIDTCKFNPDLPPVILSPLEKWCDSRSTSCVAIEMTVNNIDKGEGARCRFKQQSERVEFTTGSIESLNILRCPLPSDNGLYLTNYTISIAHGTSTRTDRSYSAGMQLVVYDSKCVLCTSLHTCKQKNGVCVINYVCHESHQPAIDDTCKQCRPDVQTTQWTSISTIETCEWNDWSTCSRLCDTGVSSRYHVCFSDPLCYLATNRTLCKNKLCQASPVEKDQDGTILLVNSTDLPQVLVNLESGIKAVAKAVNDYCGTKPDICCGMVGVKTSETQLDLVVTSSGQCHIAAGYPTDDGDKAMLKFLVKYSPDRLRENCTSVSGRQRREAREEYVIMDVVEGAVQQYGDDIGQAFGVPVVAVPKDLATSTSNDKFTYYIVGGTLGGVLLVGIIVVAVVCVKFKLSRPKRLVSMASLGGNQAIYVSPPPICPKANLNSFSGQSERPKYNL